MNKKLYTRIYQDNPADFKNPIYVGGYYEKKSGMPAKKFRLYGVLLCGAAACLLLLIGSVVSVPGKALYSALPYVAAYLPAIMGLFACLQAPTDDSRIREDTYHNSMERIQMWGALGLLFSAASLVGGIVACILQKTLGGMEILYLLAMAACAACFAVLRILRKKQIYTLEK